MINLNLDRMQLAKAFVAGREELQSIPFLVHILRGFLKADKTLDLRPVINAVEREPSIAAQVIAYAQSAAYHSAKPAISVKDAIYRIGLQNAKRVILAMALREAYDFHRCPSFDVKRYMIDTIRVAHIASLAGQPVTALMDAKEVAPFHPQEWYCIGLLHSIGLLYMVEHEPDSMNILFTEGDDISEAEYGMMGFSHYDVSAALLAAWQLPSPYHVALPHLGDTGYRGELWEVAAMIDLARRLAPTVATDDAFVELVANEWAECWGTPLPDPLPLNSSEMNEATELMEAVL